MIELTEVSKRFGASEVLRKINLTIEKGEFTCIRGKSGVGKSTLLKIMGFLETPDDGKVQLLGKEIQSLNDAERSNLRLHNIGFVFQFFNLIPSLTVLENIELPLALASVHKTERKERALELVDYFGLKHLTERFPDTLSGGERQRIAIIRALANRPRIIIADEPTSSIDDENSLMVMNLLKSINRENGVTVVLTTTDFHERLPADKDYVLRDGNLSS